MRSLLAGIVTVALGAVAIGYVVYLVTIVFDLIFRPTRRRLALRNVSRRRGEAVLVVLGAMLGTAIIVSSLVVGDSVTASIVDAARTNLGPIDDIVRVTDVSKLAETSSVLRVPPLAGTDGTLDAVAANAAVATIGPNRRAVDTATLLETDFDEARAFGSDTASTGLADAGATPAGQEAVINSRLARNLDVQPGEPIELFAYGASTKLTVRQIIPELGLAGFGFQTASGSVVTPVFVPRGTIEGLAAEGSAKTTAPSMLSQPPLGLVFLSNDGGVFAGADGSNAVKEAASARLGDRTGVQIDKSKQGLLDAAQRQGESLTQLFGGIGYFSVAAGLLLLINLFVMLSEERKTELGMLRALGFKRNHIMRTFSLEGGLYAFLASVVGGAVGIGVGAVVTSIASSIFSSGDADRLETRLAVKPGSLFIGVGIGLTISMVTVFFTSLLISRFNIILAIRDLPRPPRKQRTMWFVAGLVVAVLGALIFVSGVNGKNGILAIAGPALIAFALIFVLHRRSVTVAASAFVVVWSAAVYTVMPGVMGRPSINTFVVEGLILVAAAVVLMMQFDRMWSGVANVIAATGRGVSARLSMAYPLAHRVRTGLLLGMFTLVIFTMVFLSAFSEIFAAQAPQFTREISAGFDIMMDANPTNPVPVEAVGTVDGVADVVTLVRGEGSFTTKFRADRPNVATGISDDFLRFGAPALTTRLPQFADDSSAFQAVIKDPNLTIVPATFLQGGGGPPTNTLEPGDIVTVENPTNRQRRDLTVAAVFDREFLRNGAIIGADFARQYLAPKVAANRYYVKVQPGADAQKVAAAIQGRFVENGVSANSFAHRTETALAANQAFFSLLRSYLGIGLLIGVAGLGVVMIRAVRERRRQIGMLRAMGFRASAIRAAFLLSSGPPSAPFPARLTARLGHVSDWAAERAVSGAPDGPVEASEASAASSAATARSSIRAEHPAMSLGGTASSTMRAASVRNAIAAGPSPRAIGSPASPPAATDASIGIRPSSGTPAVCARSSPPPEPNSG
ncbi:MAG: FtsX-like permease family protein [Actinobacteria bacterium]|nr:FtsX-like permease family protein [Actinomycetota bacterium]